MTTLPKVLPFNFETAKPGNPLYCHQDFLEKLEANRSSPIGKRAALLLHRLLVDERRQPYKSTQGPNRGWRRSRLGGQGGSHFYLWWAPRGAPPLKPLPDFENAPEGAIFLRDIRHHDDHSVANPQSLNDHYIEFGARELRAAEYIPEPWTQTQSRFAGARGTIRILKGHPGSGKTTALWNAADLTTRESALYVTYSPDLASLARDHFEKYVTKEKHFRVITFSQFLRDVLETSEAPTPISECRMRFLRDIGGFSPRTLGPWADNKAALFDELHAHWAGEALPAAVGRFTASAGGHLSERVYRERRERFLGKAGIATVLDVLTVLGRREAAPLADRYFPDLALAWRVAEKLLNQPLPAWLARLDCVSIDEVQDLTPLEAFCAVQLVAAIRKAGHKHAALLVAGDEAQTIRPTDFEWGWFQDIVHFGLGDPMEFKLSTNLRSPRRIAEQVNKVWDLYAHLSKQDRPGGLGRMDMEEDSSDQLTLCAAAEGEPLRQLLEALSQREGLALLSLADEVPGYVPEHLRPHVLTVDEAKGLDFHAVCILDAGKYLEKIVPARDQMRSDHQVESLTRRLAIDQLRVAVSRPAEKLIWLNVDASDRAAKLSEAFLGVHRVIPELVIKTLEEDALDVEERVRLCEADARQYLEVKPELAFVRARQAVSLGEGMPEWDDNLGMSAYLTLSQICFTLAYRSITLPRELGRPDLYEMAGQFAVNAKKAGLMTVITSIAALRGQDPRKVPTRVADLCYRIATFADHIEPWVLNEIAPKARMWIEIAEESAVEMPEMYGGSGYLPKVYELFGIPDWQPRYRRLQEKMIGQFITHGHYSQALRMLGELPEHDIKLEAECRKGIGDLAGAAECYLRANDLSAAVDCYRSIPDFQKTIELLERVPSHPAKQSLAWIQLIQQVVEARPDNFSKVILPAEKKILEQILEGALGVSRKKRAATKKTAVKKAVKKAKKQPPKSVLF